MKKPVEAIERYRNGPRGMGDLTKIFAYLDSLPEWPADLTRERLEHIASLDPHWGAERKDALRRLALLAPKREKRKVTLWQHETDGWQRWTEYEPENYAIWLKSGWRKVGEAEIDA